MNEINTENVIAQLKQFVGVFNAAIAAIEGTYEAKVAVIVDERLKEKDEQLLSAGREIARLVTENETLKVEPIGELTGDTLPAPAVEEAVII